MSIIRQGSVSIGGEVTEEEMIMKAMNIELRTIEQE
jgi:hypothetical protein